MWTIKISQYSNSSIPALLSLKYQNKCMFFNKKWYIRKWYSAAQKLRKFSTRESFMGFVYFKLDSSVYKCRVCDVGYPLAVKQFKAKRTQHIFIVATCDFCFFQLPHTADFYPCLKQFLKRSSVKHCSRAAWELYFRPILCSSIGFASHVVHDFSRESPHTTDLCL